MTTSTPALSASDITVVAVERRTKPGLMAGMFCAGSPDTSGLYAKVEVATRDSRSRTLTLELSKMDGETGWGIDATWAGSFPVHSNGFGARYLIVKRAADAIEAAVNAAAAEAGLA